MFTKTCKICGNEFESAARNARYCCETCAKKGAKRAYNKRKRNAARAALNDTDKEITLLIQRAYKLSHEIADAFIPKKCSCTEHNHICEGNLELHHIDHNPFNMSVNNMCWVCKKAHAQIHSDEEDVDFVTELQAYAFIKEQSDIRDRNAEKHS